MGKRSIVFDYSGYRLISISKYRKRKQDELNRVRNLKIQGTKSKWVGKRATTSEYRDDISRLPRVGSKTKTYESMIAHNIHTISDQKILPIDRLPSFRGIQVMWNNAREHSLPEHLPLKRLTTGQRRTRTSRSMGISDRNISRDELHSHHFDRYQT